MRWPGGGQRDEEVGGKGRVETGGRAGDGRPAGRDLVFSFSLSLSLSLALSLSEVDPGCCQNCKDRKQAPPAQFEARYRPRLNQTGAIAASNWPAAKLNNFHATCRQHQTPETSQTRQDEPPGTGQARTSHQRQTPETRPTPSLDFCLLPLAPGCVELLGILSSTAFVRVHFAGNLPKGARH